MRLLRFFRTQPPGIMARFLDHIFFGGLKCITDRSLVCVIVHPVLLSFFGVTFQSFSLFSQCPLKW